MTPTQLQQREKQKERLIAFIKTLGPLIEQNQWGTVLLRLENCANIVRGIVDMETEEIVK